MLNYGELRCHEFKKCMRKRIKSLLNYSAIHPKSSERKRLIELGYKKMLMHFLKK